MIVPVVNRPNVEYGDPVVAKENEILRSVVGSGVHGIAIPGTDDHDEMGVYIAPPAHLLGIREFRDDYTFRTQPEGERSGPGDVDLIIYSLRKYLRLAIKGNPTALLPLYAPESDLIVVTDLGWELRNLKNAFLSRQAVERFLGYMTAQHERMLGQGKRNRVPARPELVAKYGFDTKYASHALRLAIQGHEIASEGCLTLPLAPEKRELVLDVKKGQLTQEHVSRLIGELEAEVRELLDTDRLAVPNEPDWDRIENWAIRAQQTKWGWSHADC